MNYQANSNWIFHDYLQVNGGAERVVVTLAQELKGFRLGISGIYRMFSETGNIQGIDLVEIGKLAGWLPRIPRALLAFSLPHTCLKNSRCVIYSGLYAPISVRYQNSGKKIYYCHTPPRFAFDREQEYIENCPVQLRPIFRRVISVYRLAYLRAVRSMNLVISNSDHVRQRFMAQTGLDSMVIYPPIDTKGFRFLGQLDYFVSLARLERNKRVDTIIKAFLKMPDKKLVVVSGGSEFERLKSLSDGASNIFFTGWITQEKLVQIVGNSIAAIYIPRDEDFGMAAVEAMAAGKPVICSNEGGLKESVLDGFTGILLPRDPDLKAIVDAVQRLTPGMALEMRRKCEERSQGFSVSKFVSAIKQSIQQTVCKDRHASTSF